LLSKDGSKKTGKMSEQVRSVVDKREKKEVLPTVDPQKESVKKPLKRFPRCRLQKRESG
jgi:hypothetical protein